MRYLVRVWDAPTRLFHWLLVWCVVSLVVSAQFGGLAMVWHFRFGYTLLSLLLFRLVWGFVGGHWSRFTSFFYRPGEVLQYLLGRAKPAHSVGHNPMGAQSIFALLFFLLCQVSTGLLSDDEISTAGPLVRLASNALVGSATFYHRQVGKFILLALIGLHLAAIIFYYLKYRQNLVRPMLTGDKELDFVARSASDHWSDRLKALVIWVGCCVLVGSSVIWLGQ